jgi:exopolysaccharide biosynthesis polyprenyl glycosylphosphotransferase
VSDAGCRSQLALGERGEQLTTTDIAGYVGTIDRSVESLVSDRTLEILRRRRARTVHRRGWLVRRALLAADLVGLVVAFALAQLVLPGDQPGRVDLWLEIAAFGTSIPLWVVLAKVHGLYNSDEERTDHTTPDDLVRVFQLVTIGTWVFYAATSLSGVAHPDVGRITVFWALSTVGITVVRAVARALCRRHVSHLQNTLIVGAGEVGQLIAKKLLQHPEYGINLVGFIDDEPRERAEGLEHVALLGGTSELITIVSLLDVERVVIAFSRHSHVETLDIIDALRRRAVQVDVVPRLFETAGPRVSVHSVEGIPLVSVPPRRLGWSSLLLKRSIDVGLAVLLLVLCAPLLVLLMLAIRIDSPGPALYRDERVGRGGRMFRAFKFRTMHVGAEAILDALLANAALRQEFESTHKLREDPRVTRVGRFLRRRSLDELPQLVNVLRGDLSLVGPRPITRFEFGRYAEEAPHLERYWESDLRPGLTGFWQINGRSGIDYGDRLRLDAAYVNGWSIGLDLLILAKTVRVLFARAGAY